MRTEAIASIAGFWGTRVQLHLQAMRELDAQGRTAEADKAAALAAEGATYAGTAVRVLAPEAGCECGEAGDQEIGGQRWCASCAPLMAVCARCGTACRIDEMHEYGVDPWSDPALTCYDCVSPGSEEELCGE